MTDELDLKTERNDRGSERLDAGVDRADRGARDEQLSGGRRDRSREMLRAELEKNLEDDRQAEPSWKPKGRGADIAREATTARDGASAPQGTEAGAATDALPPARLSKEAKEAWPTWSKLCQDEFVKAETSTKKGVEELRARYADIDQALSPHLNTIRSFSTTPGQAIERLFSWFQAISQNPRAAYPALMQSFGHRPEDIFGGGAQQAQQQTNNAGAQPFDPRQVLAYVDHRLNSLTEQQSFERCTAVINEFGKTHPHLQRVRQAMAGLIQSGVVPLRENSVDLEAAYSAAVKLDPELFAQVQAQERAAEQRSLKERVQRARHASSSLAPSAPGAATGAKPPKTRGKSVRDSIYEALDEARS